jgi:hypothetical protein
MKGKIISVLALAPCLAAAAAPLDEETRRDVRCFILIAQLSTSDDPETRDAGRIGSQYFLGRIDGRAPGLDLEAAVAAEAPAALAGQKTLLPRCGELMKKRGDEVEAIGNRLTARGI